MATNIDPDFASMNELARRLSQQTAASKFGLYCLRAHTVIELLQEASRACAEGLHCEFAKVLEYDSKSEDFLIAAGVGWKSGVVGHARLGGGHASPAGYAFETEKPVTSNNLSTDTRFRTPAVLLEHGVKSAINVIIRGDNVAYGVLEVDSSDFVRFDAADTAFLQGFANLLGVAIDSLHLKDELRRKDALLEHSIALEKMLVLEVHHRVKNSLSLVAALLTMQRRATENPEAQLALEQAEARIHAIAQVHDRLASNGDGKTAQLDVFVSELCARLSDANTKHKLICDVVPLITPADQAVALGLLINELVTNALKHAYSSGGDVWISIKETSRDAYSLSVRDRGRGLPADQAVTGRGLGTKVIAALARQMNATVTWHAENPGTRVTVDFSVAQKSPAV